MGNMCGTVKIFPFSQYPYLFFRETWEKWRSFLQRMTESLIQHNSFTMEIVEICQCTFCDWSGKVGPILDERISDSPESTLRWGIFANVKTLPREITINKSSQNPGRGIIPYIAQISSPCHPPRILKLSVKLSQHFPNNNNVRWGLLHLYWHR